MDLLPEVSIPEVLFLTGKQPLSDGSSPEVISWSFFPLLCLAVASRASSFSIHMAVVHPTQNSRLSCVQPGPFQYRKQWHFGWLSATLCKWKHWWNATSQGYPRASDIASFQILANYLSTRILTHPGETGPCNSLSKQEAYHRTAKVFYWLN